jgi:hypothetical protein
MTTDFHGHPVAGGTYPALIWKAFMTKALPALDDAPESFNAPPYLSASPVTVVNRGGTLERDNGVCKNAFTLEFYGGQAPPRTARCLKNEVEVPNTIGDTLVAARTHLEGQPLTPAIVYKPARAGQHLGRVLAQYPAGGILSAYDKVTLVVAKPLHGTIPRLIGLSLKRARSKLAKLHVKVVVTGGNGKVIGQAPASHTAAAPGQTVTLRTAG